MTPEYQTLGKYTQSSGEQYKIDGYKIINWQVEVFEQIQKSLELVFLYTSQMWILPFQVWKGIDTQYFCSGAIP